MTEDLDKELEDLDLDSALGDDLGADLDLGGEEGGGDLDLDAGGGEEGGDLGADLDLGGEEGGGEAGGDSVEFDADLAAMMEDSGGEDAGGDLDLGGGDMGGGGDAGGGGFDIQIPDAGSGAGLPTESLTEEQTVNLEFLLDIKLHVTFEVGRAKMLISDLLTLGQGSVIELHRLVGDELDLLVNGRLVARGEVVVVNEKFGCKITNIIAPEERIKYMGNI